MKKSTNKKISEYYIRKNAILEILEKSHSSRELEMNLKFSADADYICDHDCHKDALCRYLLTVPSSVPSDICRLIGGFASEYKEQAINDALIYALVESSYCNHLKSRPAKEQLNYIINIYHCRLLDIRKKAYRTLTVSRDKNGKPIFAQRISLDAMISDTGDYIYQDIPEPSVDYIEIIESKFYEKVTMRTEIRRNIKLLSSRELICYLLSEYFGIKPRESEKHLVGKTYSEVLNNIYQSNPYIYASLEEIISTESNRNTIFSSKNLVRSYTSSVYNAKRKITEFKNTKENISLEKEELIFTK